MLQLADAGKRFGPKLLFQNANWLITPNEKTALVGANGTGKSTLMKVLAGLDGLDYGQVQRTRGMSIGYLPQDGLALSGRTVFDECLSVFDELLGLEKEMETVAASLAELDPESDAYAAAADRFSEIDSRFRAHDGYAFDAQVGTVLTGLGFSKDDWRRRTEEFSGGWQMRIALAKLLLQKPSLLLLDEPTNHLDLETRNWLEDYLRTYPNGYILISHDRYFLDVTVDKIIEIWNKGLHVYHGNYEKYLQQKAERRAQIEAAYRNQRERIEQLEAFINRFRYQATKAKQVQSRIKELDKIERIEIPNEEPIIHFTFPQPPPSGRTVVEVSGLSKSYGPKQVLNDVSFTIDRGDRIALVGVNGAGKSTLIRLLSGQDAPTTGTLKLGHNVLAEYFAQDQYKVLDPSAHMLSDIGSIAPKVPQTELRSLLGCFLFSGDDVFKTLGVLSGGERNRYALAKILVSPGELPASRRADQPSRSARQRCPVGSHQLLHRNRHLRLSRPLLHRPPRHARLRSRRRQSQRLPRQLRRLSLAQRGRPAEPRRRNSRGRSSRCARSVYSERPHSRARCERAGPPRESHQAEADAGPPQVRRRRNPPPRSLYRQRRTIAGHLRQRRRDRPRLPRTG